MRMQGEGGEQSGNVVRRRGGGQTADAGVEIEGLGHGEGICGRVLRAGPQMVTRGCSVGQHGGARGEDLREWGFGRGDIAADEGDGGTFPRAVGAEESEDLAPVDLEAQVVDHGSAVPAEGFAEVEDAKTGARRCFLDAGNLVGDVSGDCG